jgi:hypothetical protein
MIPMNELFSAANEICAFMTGQNWRFCVIGGLAVVRWGEPRFTQDADIALLTGFGGEEQYARTLLEHFQGRLNDTFTFAMRNRVLLLKASNGIHLDVTFAALPFEEDMLDRASLHEFAPRCFLPVCSAEDLFVMKVFASRPKDLIDAESIVSRQDGKLDSTYILKHLTLLSQVKGDSGIMKQARELLGTEA